MKTSLLVALSLMLVALVIGGCAKPSAESSPESIQPSGPKGLGPIIGLEVEASTEKVYYMPGEQVEIELSVHNRGSFPVIVSPFPPEMEISSKENQQLIRSLIPESNDVQFNADETKTYVYTWDQKNSDGDQIVPGRYYLVKTHMDVWEASGDGLRGEFEGIPTSILIQHPQGAMEKTIKINQSQTVRNLTFMWRREEEIHTDVTMTLETVELLSRGTIISALCSSPHYLIGNPKTEGDRMRRPWHETAYAQFLIDGVLKYDDLGNLSVAFPEEGSRLIWGTIYTPLDPVPSDAKELTFIITRFGDWEGPWEFHVPLDN